MAHWLTSGPMYLGGRGGIGKTLLAQQLGTCLGLGRPFLDAIETPVRVLFWACEDDHDELWRRQLAICQWLGVSMDRLDGWLTIEPRLGMDNTLFTTAMGRPTWTPLRDEARAQINDLGADVFILDNIGQTFGGNENDRHHVTAYVNGLVGLRPDSGFTPLILGHPAKSTGSEFSGSTAWENAVRMRWYLGPTLPDQPDAAAEVPDPLVRYISKRKANYTAQDWRRLTFRDGVLVPETHQDGPRFDSGARQEIAQAVVRKGLRRLLEIGVDPTMAANSPDYLPRKLMAMRLHEDHSKAELAQAMNALLLSGVIAVAEVRGADRHPRKVLRLAGEGCGK